MQNIKYWLRFVPAVIILSLVVFKIMDAINFKSPDSNEITVPMSVPTDFKFQAIPELSQLRPSEPSAHVVESTQQPLAEEQTEKPPSGNIVLKGILIAGGQKSAYFYDPIQRTTVKISVGQAWQGQIVEEIQETGVRFAGSSQWLQVFSRIQDQHSVSSNISSEQRPTPVVTPSKPKETQPAQPKIIYENGQKVHFFPLQESE